MTTATTVDTTWAAVASAAADPACHPAGVLLARLFAAAAADLTVAGAVRVLGRADVAHVVGTAVLTVTARGHRPIAVDLSGPAAAYRVRTGPRSLRVARSLAGALALARVAER